MSKQIDMVNINNFKYAKIPNKTYKIDFKNKVIISKIDELDAVVQAINLILNVERYDNIIYSWNYGSEFTELYGKDMFFVIPEVEKRITEALLQDDRIEKVDEFSYKVNDGKVKISFRVKTVYGDVKIGKVVNV